MRVRKGLVGSAVAAGALLLAGSVAWACISAIATPQADVTPNRTPTLGTVDLSGSGWAAGQAVNIGYAHLTTDPVKALGVATADGSGSIHASVTAPDVAPDTYYMILTQDPATPDGTAFTKTVQFEVQAATGQVAAATAATPAPTGPASGQEWSGLRADGAKVQGLADLPAPRHSSSSPLLVVALALGAGLVLGGLALAEVRRRKVHAHAEINDRT